MNVLLIATYESGFQSLGAAVAAAHLKRAEIPVEIHDMSVQAAPTLDKLKTVDWIGFHVPMYHSLPQAFNVARSVKSAGLPAKIFFYGLYATLFREEIMKNYGDVVFNTDWEDHLVDVLKAGKSNGQLAPPDSNLVALGFKKQSRFLAPAREFLPGLDHYAKLKDNGVELLASSLEASRGCIHPCTHCPLPPVYGGKITLIPKEVVLEDIDNLVRMGARHLCFVDPDFLNAPRHSLSIVEEMNARYPFLTYDFVAKITHFRRHAQWVEKLAPLGLKYALTAMEFNEDTTLEKLRKKHSPQDLEWAIDFLRSLGVHVKPTFVFVNPWVSVEEMMELLDFIERNDLIDCVDPVQYKIRLLLFRNSLLLDDAYIDPKTFGATNEFYTEWQHENPQIESVYKDLVRVVDHHMNAGSSFQEAFSAVREVVASYLPENQRGPRSIEIRSRAVPGEVPTYDVPNFCCAEPTDENMLELEGLL